MLHTKFQGNCPSSSGGEDGGHLGHVTYIYVFFFPLPEVCI